MSTGRKLLWGTFWFLFIITPATVISIPALRSHFPNLSPFHDYGLTETACSLVFGSVATGSLLALLRSKTRGQLVLRIIVYSLAFVLLFGAISFGGCYVAGRI
jgi:hypothetical protein